MSSGPRPPRRPSDWLVSAMTGRMHVGPRRNRITVERDVRVPMRDGTILLADHYAPVTGQARPTVLMRGPYGRGWQVTLMARPFAERGYHVLLQSCRGTFGSGGAFTPGRDEAADGQDTVAWLRTQAWFSGRLATVGASYLAFTSWALALDPPPELTAMAVHISPHDLAEAGFGNGAFELYNLLSWTDLMASQERVSPARVLWRTMTADRRLAPAMDRLPLAATGADLNPQAAPWYAEWMAHPASTDPYWDGLSAAAALDRVQVPTLLISGFHDYFAGQTMRQYQALRSRGVPAALTVGPWTHMAFDLGLAIRETLDWLDAFADGNGSASSPRPSDVRVWTTGAGQWQELAQWPPPDTRPQVWYLRAGGALSASPPAGGGSTAFRYDPADPTPSAGGRTLSLRKAGSVDNGAVEARADVLTFTTAPLERPLEVAGIPEVRLHLSSDNACCDIFARLCDVDTRGRSRNLTDQIIRSAPGQVTPGAVREVTIPLTGVSHVFRAGHRIRLQVSGGAHPRFARNLGTDGNPATSTALAPVTHQVLHGPGQASALVLPAVPARAAGGSAAAGTTVAAGSPATGMPVR
jgi:uncharacterized protein